MISVVKKAKWHTYIACMVCNTYNWHWRCWCSICHTTHKPIPLDPLPNPPLISSEANEYPVYTLRICLSLLLHNFAVYLMVPSSRSSSGGSFLGEGLLGSADKITILFHARSRSLSVFTSYSEIPLVITRCRNMTTWHEVAYYPKNVMWKHLFAENWKW